MLTASISVFAAADNRPILSVDNVPFLEPGESVIIPLRLSNLPSGIYMLQLAVKYDAAKLQLTATSQGDVFSTVGAPTINDSRAGWIYLIWDSTSKQITNDCVLLNMTFTAVGQEGCETQVRVSDREECILANWETEYTPILTPGSVYIGSISDAAVFQLPRGITSVENDAFEGVNMDIVIVQGNGTPLDLSFLNGRGTRYVVANRGSVNVPEQHSYVVITPEEYDSLR